VSKVRTMIAEGRPTIRVGKGFNWPALVLGPIWAIYKSFWPAAAALVVIYGGLRMIASQATQSGYPFLNLLALLAIVAIAILVGFYANVLYAAYLTTKGYRVSAGTAEVVSKPFEKRERSGCANMGTGMAERKNLEGLGGWLVFVGLGVIVAPLNIIVKLFPSIVQVFSSGSWVALITPESVRYNPLGASILFGELFINCGLVLAWVFIAFLFFSKKKAFPKWIIGVLLFSLAFILVDALAVHFAHPEQAIFNEETTRELGRGLVMFAIWVPYMLMSERVKVTFVN